MKHTENDPRTEEQKKMDEDLRTAAEARLQLKNDFGIDVNDTLADIRKIDFSQLPKDGQTERKTTDIEELPVWKEKDEQIAVLFGTLLSIANTDKTKISDDARLLVEKAEAGLKTWRIFSKNVDGLVRS